MGIRINNNIVNQKGNPAWYEDTLAARPTANLQGRMFVDTNTPSSGIYRDTGSTWVQIADPGAGTTGTLQQVTTNGSTTNVGISITTLTPGSVLFSGTGGLISQDNTNLFWDDANNFFGIGPTGGPTALLDIHSATQNVFVQVNATSTNNSTIAFLNGGVGKWRVGNLYNAGSNDFTIYDTTNATSRLTIANTGTATYTGFIVVNNLSTAQNIQILGTAPAYTMGITSGGNYGASVGMASVSNNFIQGSVLGDMCIVNQTVGGGNLKLGVLSANAAAINISPNNRVGIATSTDAGFAFDVNGTARISGKATITGSTTATSLLAQGTLLNSTLVAAANNDFLIGLDITTTFTNGSFTGVNNYGLRLQGTGNNIIRINNGTATDSYSNMIIGETWAGTYKALSLTYYNASFTTSGSSIANSAVIASGYNSTGGLSFVSDANSAPIRFFTRNSGGTQNQNIQLFSTGNLLIQTGGTFTDAGYKLDVNGTARLGSSTNSVKFSSDANANYINQTIGSYGCYYQLASNTYPTNDKSCITIQATGSTKGIRFDGPGGYANMFINLAASSSSDMYVNIGADATGQINACSILELTSTIKGFLPPKLTTAQKTAISSPVSGLVVYDTTLNKLAVYTGAAWETVTSV